MCKISVIVPVYNTERYLRDCLESLSSQTMEDIEIIVVNDGSTDNSLAIAKEFEKRYARFKVYSTENKGSSHARNYGAEMSHGDYLAFVDSDDDVEPDYCKAMYSKAIRDGNDVVMCRADHVIQRDGQIQHITYPDTFWEEDNFRLAYHPYLLARISTGPWNKLVRRDLFFQVMFPEDLRCCEDQPFVVKTFCKAENIGVVKRILYHYYHTYGGMTFQKSFKMERLDHIGSAKQIHDFMAHNGLLGTYRVELEWFSVHAVNRWSADLIKKEASSWDARLCYAKEMYVFLQENYPHWRRNPYYKEKAKKTVRQFRPFYHRYYGKTHTLLLLYLSRFLPQILYKQVLRADHILVFICRYIRWELLGSI